MRRAYYFGGTRIERGESGRPGRGVRRKGLERLRHTHEACARRSGHLLYHPAAMDLYGSFRGTEAFGDHVVEQAGGREREDAIRRWRGSDRPRLANAFEPFRSTVN